MVCALFPNDARAEILVLAIRVRGVCSGKSRGSRHRAPEKLSVDADRICVSYWYRYPMRAVRASIVGGRLEKQMRRLSSELVGSDGQGG